jgi:hypothetical protein
MAEWQVGRRSGMEWRGNLPNKTRLSRTVVRAHWFHSDGGRPRVVHTTTKESTPDFNIIHQHECILLPPVF